MNQAELQKLIVAWKQCCAAQSAIFVDKLGNCDSIEDAIDDLDDQLDDIIDALEDWASDYSATYVDFLCESYNAALTTTTTTTSGGKIFDQTFDNTFE